jgi:hypothetical protein
MKLAKSVQLLLVVTTALAATHAKTKKPYKLPEVFNQARYVYVEAVGGQEFDPRLNASDRQAINDVDNALQDWKRYALTMHREQADLILVLRTGRLVEGRAGIQVGSGRQGSNRPSTGPQPGNGVALGGEIGPPDDLLEVYLPNPGDTRGSLLWRRARADGLNPPELALFKQLKDEIESVYPAQAASKPAKP